MTPGYFNVVKEEKRKHTHTHTYIQICILLKKKVGRRAGYRNSVNGFSLSPLFEQSRCRIVLCALLRVFFIQLPHRFNISGPLRPPVFLPIIYLAFLSPSPPLSALTSSPFMTFFFLFFSTIVGTQTRRSCLLV